MANTVVSAGSLITAAKGAEITAGVTAPASPTTGWLWLDTSVVPAVLRIYDGVGWPVAAPRYWEPLASLSASKTITEPKSTDILITSFGGLALEPHHTLKAVLAGGVGTTGASSTDIGISLNGGSISYLTGYNGFTEPFVLEVETFNHKDASGTGALEYLVANYFTTGGIVTGSLDLHGLVGATALDSIAFYAKLGSPVASALRVHTLDLWVRR